MKRLIFTLTLGLLSLNAFAKIDTVRVADFSFSPQNLTINPGDTVRWYFTNAGHTTTSGKNCTPDSIWDSHLITTAGSTYTVRFDTSLKGLTFNYYCATHCAMNMKGTITVRQTTGIHDALLEKVALRTYPNPFRANPTFDLTLSKPAKLRVSVYDLNGRLVYENPNVPATMGRNTFTPDLSGLAPGSYFTRIYAEGILVENKLVVKAE
jgi:plastocyanin